MVVLRFKKKGYSVNEHYVILNTHKYMIFVSFKSLTIDQKKSACDFIAAALLSCWMSFIN